MLETEQSSLAWAHPIVRDWFVEKFGSPTEPQALGWPHILDNRSVLISAPTGSGKTLAAFLACIDRLVRKSVAGTLENRTEVLYVSPLKALSNDVQKNLEIPLREIVARAEESGLPMSEIRVSVRTGDTLAPERRAMLKRPPHILVTTPESLYILLTAEKSREILKDVSTVIVDEIHAVADDKRGAHLALTLERLDALVGKPPVRIGLSATQKPIDQVARFLVGGQIPIPEIIEIGSRRSLDLAIEVPPSPLAAVASNAHWDEMYDRICALAGEHRSTLVFVNTRRLAERVAHHLSERLGEEIVGTHHGSLSRKLRLQAEQKLKNGEYKVLVATASLELGIDIGTVDLVCQIGSPRSIAVALQRIGRSGHWRGATPKGRIFATTRDELLECAALVKAIREADLDRLIIPDCPMDVLAQQIVAICATGEWSEEGLFQLVRGAYPYRDLARQDFDEIIEMLSEGLAGRKFRHGRYLHHDRINGRLTGRRGARLIAMTNGGAIPDNSLFTVLAMPEETVVGTVDEDFAVESNRGDIILLGNTSWKVRGIEGITGKMRVEDAHGAPPSVPFWRGEAPSRTIELSTHLSEVREKIDKMLVEEGVKLDLLSVESESDSQAAPQLSASVSDSAAVKYLMEECGMDKLGAAQSVEYILRGKAVLGVVPTKKRIVAERFFDEGGGMQLVIHAPFGGRINKAWGLALRKCFCRSFNIELQAAATDNGINISLTEQHSFPLSDVFGFLHPNSVRQILEQTALASPFFTVRWRWDANRALALLRFTSGKKVPPQIQRMRAEDLLASVFPEAAACQDNIDGEIAIPDHPLVNEVMKDVLTEALDMEGFIEVLNDILSGEIEAVAIDTTMPSEFCHEILNANPYAYLDDAPLEERRARAVEMRRILPDNLRNEIGQLDLAAVERVRFEAVPDVRDADELHDVLMSLIALPSEFVWATGQSTQSMWGEHFQTLRRNSRVDSITVANREFWYSRERENEIHLLFDSVDDSKADQREHCLEILVAGWMMYSGPVAAIDLAERTGLPLSDIERALLRRESSGTILRGHFTPGETKEEWCERVLLSRIHRLTIEGIRKQVEAVSPAQYMSWLFHWHHVAPNSQLVGERGTLEILRQLQGFEAPASLWESHILSARVRNYKRDYLDNLCLTGSVAWARFSRHPALTDRGARATTASADKSIPSRRVHPTRSSPVCLFPRDMQNWIPTERQDVASEQLSFQARKIKEILIEKGASFFQDLVRLSGFLKSEVETALWELVTVGLVTADDFDNLRALVNPKRRSGQGAYRSAGRPRHSHGRWSLIDFGGNCGIDEHLESVAWMILRRYGVVFREVLVRESNLPRWGEIIPVLRRLEARGEIRGGRFVSGFVGEQFALSESVESLRAHKNLAPSATIITVSASDPLNLVGLIVPGDRVPSNAANLIDFQNGACIDVR